MTRNIYLILDFYFFMIHPPFLQKNDLIRIVSPAGAIDPDLVKGAENTLRSWGFHVLTGSNATNRCGRFAGNDAQRLSDLQLALDDPDCKAILCSRGGYGAIHLLEKLNLEAFKRHPKWLIGYSDITLLHALVQREGFASIHGGMAKMLATQPDQTSLEVGTMLKDILEGRLPDYSVAPHALNRPGTASGTLRGGNLSILYSLRGTSYDNIPKGSILFIEDVGEQPYLIDRIMHNLRLGGVLKNLSGLMVGQFSDYQEDDSFGKSVYEIIADAVSSYAYPVCFNFPTGHVDRNLPLISGSTIRLNVSNEKTLVSYIE